MKSSVLELESGQCRFANMDFSDQQLSVCIEVNPYGNDPPADVPAAEIVFRKVASFAFFNDCCMSHRTVHDSKVVDQVELLDNSTPMNGVSIVNEFCNRKWFRYELTAGCEAIEVLCEEPAVLPG